jgi:uncharacterized protein YprB with RNaseH-like and TPR domain
VADFSNALRHLQPRESRQQLLFQAENPVSSLIKQLAFLKRHSPKQPTDIPSPDGVEESTPLGRHLVVRETYGDDHYHGNVRLGRFSCADLQRFMTLMKTKGSVASREGIVFLDTETTGIQGGTGMVPFLVGLGYFEGEDFQMVQYFIRDFDEEHSMLLALGDLLQRFRLVVTYNGSSFDVPLLETRFTLARLNSPFTGMVHLDLLPGARRLWRNRYGSCRLAALENKVVTFFRSVDIPGSMIPRAYFEFLHGRGSAVMGTVLKHNSDDVVSLAALTVCACDCTTREPAAFDNPLDLYSLARVMENTAEWQRAIDFYERALRGGLVDPILVKAQENLAVLSRRTGDHERALALCEELIARQTFSMVGYEGAAIHYERVAGDPRRALELVELALARLEGVAGTNRWQKSLSARRERLRQKAMQF